MTMTKVVLRVVLKFASAPTSRGPEKQIMSCQTWVEGNLELLAIILSQKVAAEHTSQSLGLIVVGGRRCCDIGRSVLGRMDRFNRVRQDLWRSSPKAAHAVRHRVNRGVVRD